MATVILPPERKKAFSTVTRKKRHDPSQEEYRNVFF
jgi:hypothetical protein